MRAIWSAPSTEPLTDEEMATIATLERNNRLVKGQVFLWPGANDWHDLWDEEGVIVDCPGRKIKTDGNSGGIMDALRKKCYITGRRG